MRGAAQTAKAAPSSAPDPRLRALPTKLGATNRSGKGRRPANASPNTITTKPATAWTRVELSETASPTSPAPAPSATNRIVKPATKGRLPIRTRLVVPGWPSCPASTAETVERYPGTSGRTHGATNETSPARKATGICPAMSVEARELFVDATVELGIDRPVPIQ